ncbi:ATP-binding protein [Methanobrevibacter sp.]|uniref:AAA family ATPase n=1 Tax=Methanobrevibacter sp. TaxID=66852 RepID=UPI0025D86751|nr:ATP-binding protein [Methanobrevibacter sp.]MEE0025091.1 ATP-binding protein [Methanobrevibacter sp.]
MKTNPFRKRTGILPSYFTGRDNELNELKKIYNSTKNGIPGHLILYGSKGIGKTSLLLKFQEEISDFDDLYSVRIPLIEGDFEDIYSLIIEKCSDTLNININHFWQKINSLSINIPFIGGASFSREIPQTSPAVAFEKILNVIYDELDSDNPVLILLFDDLQRIMGNDETMKILSILQNALVELNLKGKNIMFVATGSEDIFNKIQDKLDSAVRIFEPYLIGPLSYSEVCDAINIPIKEQNVTFEDDVLKEIYELSNGIPYYMQILAYNCFEQTNEDDKVTMAEFKDASVHSLNILAQREFKALFNKSTTEERKILCLMAESDETLLSYSYIKENAHLNSEPSALLKSLINKNMIIKPARGKYKLKSNLFKLYLQSLRINQDTGLIG